MSVTGTEQPTKVGVPIADLLAGMNLAYGVVAALHERHTTGVGRVVRTSLLAGVVGVHAFQGTRWLLGGEVPGIAGAHHPAIAPYGMFESATSPVQVAVGSEGLWRRFAAAVGLDPDEERFRTNRERVAHRGDLVAAIEAVFSSEPAEHWLELLVAAGIPAGKVRSMDDVYAWEQVRSQGLVLDVDHPSYGALQLTGSPLRFDDHTYSGGRETHLPPPLLGEHNDTIRSWLDESGT
jgi:crotonobetainyl-CoA:carnitine CoA-transferase CaiB-like acyl-CoA transferase